MQIFVDVAAGEELGDTVATLAALASGSDAEASAFAGCAADWAAFVELLAVRAPQLAGELQQQLDAVSAVFDGLSGGSLSDGVGSGVSMLLQKSSVD